MAALIVVTGAPGTGKTTLMQELQGLGLAVIGEPARQILAEQRACGGQGLPELNPGLFITLMRERAVKEHQAATARSDTVIFDRGMPDSIAYARHFGLYEGDEVKAATEFRYHPKVFICPPWEAIYTTDSERKMSFAAVESFHADLIDIYQDVGYELCELPRVHVRDRAQFFLHEIQPAIK